MEFGDNAVYLGGFLTAPALTNQQYNVLSGVLNGFDFPDLNGAVPHSSAGGAPIRRAGFDALPASLSAGAIVPMALCRRCGLWSASLAELLSEMMHGLASGKASSARCCAHYAVDDINWRRNL